MTGPVTRSATGARPQAPTVSQAAPARASPASAFRAAGAATPAIGRLSHALLGASLALLLTACATRGERVLPAGDHLSGRMTVQVDATATTASNRVSAAFELDGSPQRGQLGLTTPLGTTLAQARWEPGDVRLLATDGERRYADLDALTRDVLGESLPVAALFDWLRGRPWAGAPSTPSAPPAPAGFSQLGWTVDLARFGESWISAERAQAPRVTVRAKLDAP